MQLEGLTLNKFAMDGDLKRTSIFSSFVPGVWLLFKPIWLKKSRDSVNHGVIIDWIPIPGGVERREIFTPISGLCYLKLTRLFTSLSGFSVGI